jgi:hypothetical protein
MLACMLVPLPTAAVDLLLSLSLAAAVVLLVASLAVRRSAELLGFPGLLLLVTLSRLALNVATTRLILSQADAGRVIDAFAGLVVRGDIVVGAVMFAVITAVQYLVIARGSERVAEVAARFALDGLPGRAGGDRRGPEGGGDLGGGGGAAAGGAARAVELLRGDGRGGRGSSGRRDRGAGDHDHQPGRRGRGRGDAARDAGRREPRAVWAPDDRRRAAGADPRAAGEPGGGRAGDAGRPRRRRRRPLAWLEPAMLVVPAALLAGLAAVPGMPRLAFVTTAIGLVCAGLWLAARERGGGAVSEPTPRSSCACRGGLETLRDAAASRWRRCAARCADGARAIDLPAFDRGGAGRMAPGDPGAVEVRHGVRVLGVVTAAELTGLMGQGEEDMSFGPGKEPAAAVIEALLIACFRAVMNNAEALYDLQQLEAALERARRRHPAQVREALRVLPAGRAAGAVPRVPARAAAAAAAAGAARRGDRGAAACGGERARALGRAGARAAGGAGGCTTWWRRTPGSGRCGGCGRCRTWRRSCWRGLAAARAGCGWAGERGAGAVVAEPA